jgi:uncharacterized protein (TIGR03086 family)
LGDEPKDASRAAREAAVHAAAELPSIERTVHLSASDFPASFYLTQLIFDHVVHAWDLATATGTDPQLDPELVDFSVHAFGPQENSYRSSGAIGDRPDIPTTADVQTRLLAMFGRNAT